MKLHVFQLNRESSDSLLICVFLTLVAPAIPGCILFPNARVEGYGVISRVIDAETETPVPNAQVSDVYHSWHYTKTDSTGQFRLQPHVQWHAGMLIGPIVYPILPFTGDVIMPHRSIRIAAPGYDEVNLLVCERIISNDPVRKCVADVKDDFFVVPPISVQKMRATSMKPAPPSTE